MEKQNQSTLSLLALLPNGKVENDVRIADKTVTGICTVYVNRTDGEKEFLLREIGVAALDGSNLTEAARTAVKEAYDAAISHIAGAMPATAQPTQDPVMTRKSEVNPVQKQEAPPPVSDVKDTAASKTEAEPEKDDETDDTPDTGEENSYKPVNLDSIIGTEPHEADFAEDEQPDDTDTPADGGIERIEFSDSLLTESDLQDNDGEAGDSGDDDGIDPEYKKALDTVITIFGKMHECNNWTAGKMLNEKPDVIVDFCHRNSESQGGVKYTGPRVDQREALFKLFPDAVRKMLKAA